MRGGKGKAGGRKHFWIRTIKYEPERYKRIGFKPPSALKPRPETINVGELGDLARLGYGKLLGRGEVGMPLRLRVPAYTPTALEKVEAAGGEIVEPK